MNTLHLMHKRLAIAAAMALCGIPVSHVLNIRRAQAIESALCSLGPFTNAKHSSQSFLVATALGDTVLAGAGDIQPSGDGGHWGSGKARAVHGQLVRVDTIANAHAESIRLAIKQRTDSAVIIVPWDYDSGCQPTYWNRTARWIEPGLTGLYSVRPRSKAQWIAGRPTFDAFAADLQPYPHGAFYVAGYRGTGALRTRESLTPRELFSLYDALPAYESAGERSPLDSLRSWAQRNPVLSRKYPADVILRDMLPSQSRTPTPPSVPQAR